MQAQAAWCLGSTINNNYDYQLWILEDFNDTTIDKSNFLFDPEFSFNASKTLTSSSITILDRLVNLFADYVDLSLNGTMETVPSDVDLLLRRVFFAISGAARGCVDVQTALQSPSSRFLTALFRVASSSLNDSISWELKRKVWAFLDDMLQERRYIRQELLEELSHMSGFQDSKDNNVHSVENGEKNSSSNNNENAIRSYQEQHRRRIEQAIDNLQLLGDSFVDWMWLEETMIKLHSLISPMTSKVDKSSIDLLAELTQDPTPWRGVVRSLFESVLSSLREILVAVNYPMASTGPSYQLLSILKSDIRRLNNQIATLSSSSSSSGSRFHGQSDVLGVVEKDDNDDNLTKESNEDILRYAKDILVIVHDIESSIQKADSRQSQ